jgi:hypothetical protein
MSIVPHPTSDPIRDALLRHGFAVAAASPGAAGLLAPGVNGMLALSREVAIAGEATAAMARMSLCAAARAEGRVVRVGFGKTWRPQPGQPSDALILGAELVIGQGWAQPFVAASAVTAYRMMRRLLGDLQQTLQATHAETRGVGRTAHLVFAACGELATGRSGLVAPPSHHAAHHNASRQPIDPKLCRRLAIELLPDLMRALREAAIVAHAPPSQRSTAAPDSLIVVERNVAPRLCAEPDEAGAPSLHHRSLQ